MTCKHISSNIRKPGAYLGGEQQRPADNNCAALCRRDCLRKLQRLVNTVCRRSAQPHRVSAHSQLMRTERARAFRCNAQHARQTRRERPEQAGAVFISQHADHAGHGLIPKQRQRIRERARGLGIMGAVDDYKRIALYNFKARRHMYPGKRLCDGPLVRQASEERRERLPGRCNRRNCGRCRRIP